MEPFTDLSDAENACRKLEAEVDAMLAIQAGISAVLTSLMAKHPDYLQFQLYLTSIVELSDQRAWKVLTEKQRTLAREYVEGLQQIHEERGQIRPLG